MILFLEFILIGGLNFLTPYFSDDFYMTNNHYTLETFIQAAKYDYLNWNGRIVGQNLLRIFMNIPNPLFRILNAAMFCLLTFLILLYTSKNWRRLSPLKYLAIIGASWLFLPAFGQAVLWVAGASNYLWTTDFILLMGLPYLVRALDIQTFTDKQRLNRYVKAGLIMILGLIAGWSNENTSGGLIMGIVLLMLYQRFIANRRFQLWQFTGLLSTIVGFLALITANGNKVRTAQIVTADYLAQPFFHRIATGIGTVSDAISSTYMPLLFTLLAALVVMHVLWFQPKRALQTYLFTLMGFATLYVLAAAPTGADGGRAFFGGIVFLLIALFASIPDNFEISENTTTKVWTLAQMAFVVAAIFSFFPGFTDLYHANAALKTRYSYIQQQAATGKQHIKVPPLYYYPATKYAINYNAQELGKNPDIFPNAGYAHYFQVKGITLKK